MLYWLLELLNIVEMLKQPRASVPAGGRAAGAERTHPRPTAAAAPGASLRSHCRPQGGRWSQSKMNNVVVCFVFFVFFSVLARSEVWNKRYGGVLAVSWCWKWPMCVLCESNVQPLVLTFADTNTRKAVCRCLRGASRHYYSHRKSGLWDAPGVSLHMPKHTHTNQTPHIQWQYAGIITHWLALPGFCETVTQLSCWCLKRRLLKNLFLRHMFLQLSRWSD